jgi:serine/threonine protein kinase
LVTEYYQRGTLRDLLKSPEFSGYTLTARLKLVLEYVKAIEFLHTGSEHPRVYCDSNKLDGTTKQYLLTDDGRLVIGDLDDVPEVVAGEKIVCKHADFLYNRTDILKEGFLAPEQQIITSTTETVTSSEVPAKTDTLKNKKSFSAHSPEKVSKLSTPFPKFDHRADIFKIADVAVHIITGGTYAKPDSVASGTNVQGVPSAEFLMRAKQLLYSENSELARIFALCRSRNPDRRPDVGLVRTALNRVVVLRVKRGLL